MKSYIAGLFARKQNKENCFKSNTINTIDNSPFNIVKGNEDGTEWLLTFANYKLKGAKTQEELKQYMQTNTYNIVCDLIIIINEIKEKKYEK